MKQAKEQRTNVIPSTLVKPLCVFQSIQNFNTSHTRVTVSSSVTEHDDDYVRALNHITCFCKHVGFSQQELFKHIVFWYMSKVKAKRFDVFTDQKNYLRPTFYGQFSLQETICLRMSQKQKDAVLSFSRKTGLHPAKLIRISFIRFYESSNTLAFKKQLEKTKKELKNFEAMLINMKG